MANVYGYIKNSTGGAIPFASVSVFDAYFAATGEAVSANNSGYFFLDIDPNNEPYGLSITSVGYKPATVKLPGFVNGSIITLQQNVVELPPVVVTSTKSNSSLWLALLPLVAIIADKEKKKKVSGIGKVDANTVIMVGGGLIGLTVLNKILVSLGVTRGAGGKAVYDEQTNPNSPWKPAYYHSLPGGTPYYTLTEAQANNFSYTIYNAFTLFKDNFDSIMGVFSQLKTKTQVSVLAERFQNKYNRDLLTFLGDGGGILPWDGLSDTQFKTLTDYVNNLPATWP